MQNGEYVAIKGTTSYNGIWKVSERADDTFKIVATFVADDATGTIRQSILEYSVDASGPGTLDVQMRLMGWIVQ
jgi:hypothetical protein